MMVMDIDIGKSPFDDLRCLKVKYQISHPVFEKFVLDQKLLAAIPAIPITIIMIMKMIRN